MGTGSQESARGSRGANQRHQSGFEHVTAFSTQAGGDLTDEFNGRYGGAYERIIDLARPTGDHQGRDQLSGVPDQSLDQTYQAVKRQLKAMGAKLYEIGVKTTQSMIKREWNLEQVLKFVPWLKRENAKGAEILVRPAGKNNQGLTLVDGMNRSQIDAMKRNGAEPAVIIETSPERFQSWIKFTDQPLTEHTTIALSKAFAKEYGLGVDHGTGSDFGRLAGFLNQEPELKTARGHNPRVLCIESEGQQASRGQFMVDTMNNVIEKQNAEIESKRRLKRAHERTEGYFSDKLVHRYQKDFNECLEGLNRRIDQTTLDTMICIRMAKSGIRAQDIAETLQKASPEAPLRQAAGDTQYGRDLVNSIFENPEIRKEISKSRSQSQGFSR